MIMLKRTRFHRDGARAVHARTLPDAEADIVKTGRLYRAPQRVKPPCRIATPTSTPTCAAVSAAASRRSPVDAGLTCPNRDGTVATGGCIYCNARGSGTGAHAPRAFAHRAARGRQGGHGPALPRAEVYRLFPGVLEHARARRTPAGPLRGGAGRRRTWWDSAIGTRPDCVVGAGAGPAARSLPASRLIWVEYGLQSARDATLARIGRGHDAGLLSAARWRPPARRGPAGLRARDPRACPARAARTCTSPPETLAAAGDRRGQAPQPLRRQGHAPGGLSTSRGELPLPRAARVCRSGRWTSSNASRPRSSSSGSTGDPHPEELAAPAWCRDKAATLNAIRRPSWSGGDTWQGSGSAGIAAAPAAS
ncbi:MAG: hypothetical protein MZV70_13180 [Desulfobacterales bacterium]|nr:hypothetical protein [Desulfobacterales bacterium]